MYRNIFLLVQPHRQNIFMKSQATVGKIGYIIGKNVDIYVIAQERGGRIHDDSRENRSTSCSSKYSGGI